MLQQKRLRNSLFIVTAAVVLLCVLGTKLALHGGVSFPEWTEIGAKASQIEGRILHERPAATKDGILSGEFQSSMDEYLADAVPLRGGVLLANAYPQRLAIELANCPFGFEAYPTFYGSNVCVVPDVEMVTHCVSEATDEAAEAAGRWCQILVDAADDYPNTRFVYQVVGHPTHSETNPVSGLVSYDTYDDDWVMSNVAARLEGSRVCFLYDPIASRDDFVSNYFSTEEHWTHERSLRAYNQLAVELGLQVRNYESERKVSDAWYGVACRSGRTLDWSSGFWDPTDDYSQLDVANPGLKDAAVKTGAAVSQNEVFDLYNRYYANINNEVVNRGPNNGRTCLVIGTSYIASLIDPIAANYQKTVFIAPSNTEVEGDLNDYLRQGFDDVIVQHLPPSALGIKSKSPSFLEAGDSE